MWKTNTTMAKTATMHHPHFGNIPISVTQNNRAPYKTHQLYLHGFQSILKLFTKSLFPYIEQCLKFLFLRCFGLCRSRDLWPPRVGKLHRRLKFPLQLLFPPPSPNLRNSIKMAPKQPREPYTEEDIVNAIFDITENGIS